MEDKKKMKGLKIRSNISSNKENSIPETFAMFKDSDYNGIISSFANDHIYKICLLKSGEGIIAYDDKSILVKGNSLVFTNPSTVHSWKPLDTNIKGFTCLFTEEFVNHHLRSNSLSRSLLFQVNGNHVVTLDHKSFEHIYRILEQMYKEWQSSYSAKFELLRSYLQVIIHESVKFLPILSHSPQNYKVRLTDLFMELLENQFPIDTPQQRLKLKNAYEFATRLAIHTNHLNRAVKERMGNTTSQIISERILKEAENLLRCTDWNISEIAHALGFGHTSNFNIFFKKRTGQAPTVFRKIANNPSSSNYG
ncbi:helix-turn-helix domain-containing protein [Pedobacter antarcticus]|uniref:helix-turn-helix domain-containing protein n=1 Tax=Pedobacter antarcticus TaxID=34086 RepID=UPI00292D0C5A|nr:helix-turn-helix domain-containing protein [Pedobacter antarcticus]